MVATQRVIAHALTIAVLAIGAPAVSSAQQNTPQPGTTAAPTVAIDQDDIGGVVTSRLGPEAGVWVIAENLRIWVPVSPRWS